MILVQVLSAMREDDVRLYRFRQGVHGAFYFDNVRREESIRKLKNVDRAVSTPLAPSLKRVESFRFAFGTTSHHDPIEAEAGVAF